MIHVLIEESYSRNNRTGLVLEGIYSVTRRKRIAVKVCSSEKELENEPRIVILICASLKWAEETIAHFNARGIHPLIFGYQYLDTVYQYSSVMLTYTISTYMITKYLLLEDCGEIAFLGFNKDSLPDRLKFSGAEYAAEEFGVLCRPFYNCGDSLACIEEFRKSAAGVKNIVCSNDVIAVLLRCLHPKLLEGRQMCSCSGLKMSEYIPSAHPTTLINYYKAGVQLANLYLFLEKNAEISPTHTMLDMDICISGDDPVYFPMNIQPHSTHTVDFYGDPAVQEIDSLENMLLKCDEMDLSILKRLMLNVSYERIAELENVALNTIKYRVYAIMKNADICSKKKLVSLIEKYGLKFL